MKRLVMICLTAAAALGLLAGTALADKYKPGKYTGSAPGYSKKKHPGKIEVEVTVDANAIKDIKLVTFEQTTKGKQGEKTAAAKEKIPAEILSPNSL